MKQISVTVSKLAGHLDSGSSSVVEVWDLCQLCWSWLLFTTSGRNEGKLKDIRNKHNSPNLATKTMNEMKFEF